MRTARHWAEQARLNEARLEALLKLGQMTEAPLKEITDFALEQAVLLTKSEIGYLAFMNDEETVLTMHSWSKTAMKECAIADKPLVYPLETTGLWGEAARQRKPIITNDYAARNRWKKGLPEGHVPLVRHMNVPIFDAARVVIVAGVGNKAAEYDESDVRQLTLLMEGMWMLLQRHRAHAELRRHRDHLEQLVEERAAELATAYGDLQHSHAELQAIYDGMADGLLIADLETRRFVRANAAICRMLGCAEKEVLSMSVMGIPLVDDFSTVLDRFERLTEGQSWRSENVPIRRKNGTVLHADITTNHIVYRGRPCLVGLFHDTTERKKAEEAMEREKRILKHLLESSDHERQLISYEIHDGLAQQLAGATMQFNAFAYLKDHHPKQAAKAYTLGLQMLRESHAETRRLIYGLKPLLLDEVGVAAAVESFVHEANQQGKPKIEFHSAEVGRLEAMLEHSIFRIIQESITNARRYSKSKKVRIDLARKKDRIQVEIQDWGVGFDVERVRDGHFGLAGIQERARAFGGHAIINSTPGKGTRIVVDLPALKRSPSDHLPGVTNGI
jgi:PAS domain S-box-containing protein